MATSGMTTSPQVLSAASRCPYIQQVVDLFYQHLGNFHNIAGVTLLALADADVGDPQTVSNSLAPFLSLATAVTGATGVAAAQPSASGSAGADPSAPVVGASGGEVSEEAVTASTAATAEKPAGAAD